MKYKCKTCRHYSDCRTAFGKFWDIKSRSGLGCDSVFIYDRSQSPSVVHYTEREKVQGDLFNDR